MDNRYIILSEKKWHESLFENLTKKNNTDFFYLINSQDDFNFKNLKNINPRKIFIPHWSYIIPKEIFENFECIVFHMTDLPYGRGGSPLQNLIVEGHKETKISALRVEKGLDTGDIYLKKDLNLDGSAQQIFERSATVLEEMIQEILEHNIVPKEQNGEITVFKRRTPSMSNIDELNSLEKIYDYIRMLDAEGYPHAYIENKFFKFEFTGAELSSETIIDANVRIIKK